MNEQSPPVIPTLVKALCYITEAIRDVETEIDHLKQAVINLDRQKQDRFHPDDYPLGEPVEDEEEEF